MFLIVVVVIEVLMAPRPIPSHRVPILVMVLVLLGLGLSPPAQAHKLRVFAAAEGPLITGSAYFAGGGAAGGARIRVLDAQGRTLAEPTPDAAGRFSYRAQAAADLLILAETGDGHRAEWRIPASDLAGSFPTEGTGTPEQPAAPPAAAPTAPAAAPPTPAPTGLDPLLTAAIEGAVARQIRPLREELQSFQEQARLRDVLGGIGYILGLMGLALWWRSRRTAART
jgi:nickel transport protein